MSKYCTNRSQVPQHADDPLSIAVGAPDQELIVFSEIVYEKYLIDVTGAILCRNSDVSHHSYSMEARARTHTQSHIVTSGILSWLYPYLLPASSSFRGIIVTGLWQTPHPFQSLRSADLRGNQARFSLPQQPSRLHLLNAPKSPILALHPSSLSINKPITLPLGPPS